MRVTVERLPGVESAVVSLNDGLATIDFAAENGATVSGIRAAIRAQGFSPREATVRIKGSLEDRDGVLVLVAPGQTYFLVPPASAAPLRSRVGTQVTVEGRIGQDVEEETPGELELLS